MTNINKGTINTSPLYKIGTKSQLANCLTISPKELKKAQSKSNDNYICRIDHKKGKPRNIEEPKLRLKKIYSTIKTLLSNINAPLFLFSGVKGRSHIKNGGFHKNLSYIVRTDINSFYKRCSCEHIFRLFRYRFEMPDDVAWCLTDIVSYNGYLPTGSPCSQLIAFFAYEKMFKDIEIIATHHGAKMSLYVDDITFSSHDPIPNLVMFKTSNVLRQYGFEIKRDKTKHYGKREFALVTGIAIAPNNDIKVSNKLLEKIHKERDSIRKKSLIASARQIEPFFEM
ncbi:reverse transcriptase family protein [Thermoproteota archaeon]